MAKGLVPAAVVAWLLASCAAGPPAIDFDPAPSDEAPKASTRDGGVRLLGYVAARDSGTLARDVVQMRATSSRPLAESGAPAGDGRAADVPFVATRDRCAGSCLDGFADDVVESSVEESDSLEDCSNDCARQTDHLLLSEIVTRPNGSEMIEIVNPTAGSVDLTNYWLSDSHLYPRVATGDFPTASGSDFAARFPAGAAIGPGEFRTIALSNASGGSVSFAAAYGHKPDFELRPTANGADDDADVPDMLPSDQANTIGATASLTDAGEPVVLFYRAEGGIAHDVDYVFFGEATTSNAVVDKTGEPGYLADTAAALQRAVAAPGESGAIHRCIYGEPGETRVAGNGITGHDETSEDAARSFVVTIGVSARTPGGPPPPGACPP